MRRLAPYATYGAWLEGEHPEDRRYTDNNTAFIEARVFWLDDLIKEFEAAP